MWELLGRNFFNWATDRLRTMPQEWRHCGKIVLTGRPKSRRNTPTRVVRVSVSCGKPCCQRQLQRNTTVSVLEFWHWGLFPKNESLYSLHCFLPTEMRVCGCKTPPHTHQLLRSSHEHGTLKACNQMQGACACYHLQAATVPWLNLEAANYVECSLRQQDVHDSNGRCAGSSR